MKAINEADATELEFGEETTAEWAVAYGYCSENNKLPWLFELAHYRGAPWIWQLPIKVDKGVARCGNWVSCSENDSQEGAFAGGVVV